MKTKTALTLIIFFGLSLVPLNIFAQDFPYISFGGHTERTRGLAFSADGKTLASGSDGGTIIIWEVDTGNKLRWIRNLGGDDGSNTSYYASVYEVSLNPDASIVASAGYPSGDKQTYRRLHSLRLWEVGTGKLLWQRQADPEVTPRRTRAGKTLGVAFSPDGSTVASGGSDNTIDLWDASTGDALRTLVGHTHVIRRVVFSADGELLASASEDKTVRVWEANTGRSLYTLTRHTEPVNGVAFSPDGQTLASASGDGTVIVWDVTTGRYRHILTGHEGWVSDVAFSPDGRTVVSGGEDGTIRLWDAGIGRQIHTLKAQAQAVWGVAFSPTEQKFASAHADGAVLLWELPDTHVRIAPEVLVAPAVGKQFTIDINIGAGTDVKAYEAHLTFDATTLRHVSATDGDYLPAGAFFSAPVVSDNTVILGATAITGTSNGDGKLATVTFEVLERSESFIDLYVKLTDSKDRDIHVLSHSTKVEAFPIGDVNKDDIVNIQDLVLVASSFGQPIPEEGNPADVNGDGVINVIDLVIAAGALGKAAAAPTVVAHARDLSVTRADVQRWLSEARSLNPMDATAHRGIRFLEQLLAALTPKETALLANYPNPFNPETWIPYQLAESTDVSIAIYAANGQRVRVLTLGHQPVGIYEAKHRAAYWDGKNAQGESVASGVYFYTLTAGDFAATRKMLILK